MTIAHLQREDWTSKSIKIEIDSMELIIGEGRCPLKNPKDLRRVQATHCWIAGASEILEAVGGCIKTNRSRFIQEQRTNDKFLMNIISVHCKGLERLQCCC